MSKASYVAYIDESGDDGLTRVKPIDPDGASEWFVLAAIVAPTDVQKEATWVRNILTDLKLHQRRHLDFQALDDRRRLAVCETIAKLPVRCFAVLSNKRNMRRYNNPRAERVSYTAGRTWYYWWVARLLLERVSNYCERRSLHEHKEPRLVRLEFSRRGGLRYSHFQSYLFWLRMQSKAGALWLKQGDLSWPVIDPVNEIRVYDHAQRAGLQLADAVAGSFFQSVHGQFAPALALEPRMAHDATGRVYGYGLKLMPGNYLKRAPAEQRPVFDFYASLKKRQAPGS